MLVLFLTPSLLELCSDSNIPFACSEDDSDEEDLPLTVENGNSTSVECCYLFSIPWTLPSVSAGNLFREGWLRDFC